MQRRKFGALTSRSLAGISSCLLLATSASFIPSASLGNGWDQASQQPIGQRIGSAFTVYDPVPEAAGGAPDNQLNWPPAKVMPWSETVDFKPNEAIFDVARIEFRDDGSFKDDQQLPAALRCIEKARTSRANLNGARADPNGAVVVVFVHGWNHNARWDGLEAWSGDDHFRSFRRVLLSLSWREAERYGLASKPLGRRVVGIYLGWEGDKQVGWRRHWLLTFRNRYNAARAIGESDALRRTLGSILKMTKQRLNAPGGEIASPLIVGGHSMGAMILERGLLRLLDEKPSETIYGHPADNANVMRREPNGDRPVIFPDLVMLLNSAAEWNMADELLKHMKNTKLTRRLEYANQVYEAPMFISATSVADRDTRVLFPLVRWSRTDGNYPGLRTHRLNWERDGVSCPAKDPRQSFGQAWHCLRHPRIDPHTNELSGLEIDLPDSKSTADPLARQHVRYRLSPIPGKEKAGPFWLFNVPGEIIGSHNDIFNARSSLLIMALMQASGAVMSLAEDWKDVFEPETQGTSPN